MTTQSTWILDHLTQLQSKRILVIGDVGLDVYLMGDVKRISPEAPVPVLDVRSEDARLGLSANVANNVQTLGGECVLVSVVGEDQGAEDLKALLKENKIDTRGIITDRQRPTTRKMRLLAGQHHIARVDFEKKTPLSDTVKKQVLKNVSDSMASVDCVILQDYAKGLLDRELCQAVIQLAHQSDKKVLVDPYRSSPLENYKGAYLMTPNRDESLDLARQKDVTISDQSSEDIDVIGRTLMKSIASEQMVVTLGSSGMRLFSKDKTQTLPTYAQNVFDVTGAGDTVISAISLALSAGWSLEHAGILANFAAGVVVGKVGCVPCELEDLKAFLRKT